MGAVVFTYTWPQLFLVPQSSSAPHITNQRWHRDDFIRGPNTSDEMNPEPTCNMLRCSTT